ncbi:phosphopantetheine-binding protein [Methylocaldum sp.]|uniref:phosphopantetheine-binding protein n=1 Tax=Methylocaldum sp. TaxID=1969727 RepID=UPI002D36E3C1|nr:phosphopantetheine-binding protein [Methylocaldum sp.]HYE37212.1 phosphopantetheine-binding protein [Methylocaldum sp.]
MTSQLTPMELDVARMIVESLNLEAIPEHIEPEKPLYREGLGLDSIDLLELSLVISKKYGFQIKSDDPDVTNIFSSLRALTDTIEKRRAK